MSVDDRRRKFLKVSGVTAALVASNCAVFAKTDLLNIKKSYPNRNYTQEMYRNEFSFMYGVKQEHGYAFHCVKCKGKCSWEVYSHNGVITRENQTAKYPSISDKVPDFNPRGCSKGAQHSQIMYQKDRILYPMVRVGKRGEGRWKRVSWDVAAERVCQNIFETLSDSSKGPSKLMLHSSSDTRGAAIRRFGTLLGAQSINRSSHLKDKFSGVQLAYGRSDVGCSWDFMYGANTIVMWGANPSVTRTPDAHFINEAKYNGAKVIVITPEFNASAKSADLWIPVKRGSDNILAMSIIHTIINEKLYKPEFMINYTDLPFLVDMQSKKLIRRSELEAAKDKDEYQRFENEFYSWDKKSDAPFLMPASSGSKESSLRVDKDIDIALEGEFSIVDIKKRERKVTTVFELLKKSSENFSPKETEELTGVHVETVMQLSYDIAKPDVVEITAGFSLNRYFNSLMTLWNISSICGLTGRMGPYGGLNTEYEFNTLAENIIEDFDGKYRSRTGSSALNELILAQNYFSDEDIARSQGGVGSDEYLSSIKEVLSRDKTDDNNISTAVIVADESFHKKSAVLRDEFLKQIEFYVYADYKMSETAQFADVLLPLKSDYELYDIDVTPSSHRFVSLSKPVENIKKVGDSKDEWAIFTFLAKKLQEIATRDSNIDRCKIKDDEYYAKDGFHDLSIFYREFTNISDNKDDKKPALGTDKMAVEALLENSREFKGWSIDKMVENGGFLTLDKKVTASSPLYSDRSFSSMENTLYRYEPLPTLSGRQTFYIDHDMFIKMGVATNSGVSAIKLQDSQYPYLLITPRSRWSINYSYRSSRTLLRLQRGVPSVVINEITAQERAIEDMDYIKVYNSLGEFYAMAKLSTSVPSDAVVFEYGWESYMHKFNRGVNELSPLALNLLDLSDGWGHLKFSSFKSDIKYVNDITVNFKKAEV
jgi:complex iron-sulfur molybdoenzyme family reductase subunit alpha